MVELTSPLLRVEIAPEVGGRIVHFVDRATDYDFLWHNPAVPLRREAPGAEYDPNFFGGIDELLPNDIPERIAGIDCPDHGEHWTTAFDIVKQTESSLSIEATLSQIRFKIDRRIEVAGRECRVHTRLTNLNSGAIPFLWKLHAAMSIKPGDRIECPATSYTAADPDWSRRKGTGLWHGETVPEFDGSTEFLYLHSLADGWIEWQRSTRRFRVRFDPNTFPFAWYFASYGGFDGHHVAILEPCTSMPISVNEAMGLGQCPILAPGGSLETDYSYEGTIDEN
ncbi:MAG: hypothetical protein P4L46_06955 [Fimbriimonas sp.]|nr:hypothetical protein [Fimbriimonas sp.]